MKQRSVALALVVMAIVGLSGCPNTTSTKDGKDDLKAKNGQPSLANLQKLLDRIPKDSQPRADNKGEVERNKANEWMKKNIAGEMVELSVKVGHVLTQSRGDKTSVCLTMGEGLLLDGKVFWYDLGYPGQVRSGGSSWAVLLCVREWKDLDEAPAKRLRDLDGKTITILGQIAGAEFWEEVFVNTSTVNGPCLRVELKDVTVNGFDPSKK